MKEDFMFDHKRTINGNVYNIGGDTAYSGSSYGAIGLFCLRHPKPVLIAHAEKAEDLPQNPVCPECGE